MSTDQLAGMVAAILNDRELVINLGQEQGVIIGTRFKVMDQEKKVFDPATGEELGVVRREKLRVKVTEVQAKLCIARTYETYQVKQDGSSGWSSIAEMMRPAKTITRVKTLRFDDSGLDYGPLDEKQSFVKVGDPVQQLGEAEA